ncbi:hypothetical protein OROMI_032385 [Orobanche minor]
MDTTPVRRTMTSDIGTSTMMYVVHCFLSRWKTRRRRRTMRLIITTALGIMCGFFLGVSFPPTLPLTKIWVPTNPRGAERLPPDVIVAESDLYTRRSWGLPTEWWYAKRFLHPDIVAPYDYIFIWDEDVGIDNFDAEEYIKLVTKHGLDISQPGLSPDSATTWKMTQRREDTEVHKDTEETPGLCTDPHLPPCAAFVEIMAPVFSRDAWRCVWHMIQNDLVHGWGLDFALRECVEKQPAHERIGVVDSQWIVHQDVTSLGNQGKAERGKTPWEGVRERCKIEWAIFEDRMNAAIEAMEIETRNSTAH